MTIRDIAVAFGYEVDQASVNRAEGTIKGISNMAKKLLGGISIYFSVRGISELAQAAADVEALESQFTQVFGNMEDEAAESLQGVADEAGALVNRMKGSFTQLAAFTKTTGADEAEALALAERGMKAAADSSAFYDRSLEQVTASLQSFLKGNYENDAALGLSCTETTRNAAANKLYGKSFQQLSEYQKQLTLLQMVEDANKLSGALGQAARESDTWTNQLGNMKQAFQDLKAAAGSGFLKPGITALKLITSLIQKATVEVKKLTDENGLLTRGMEKGHAIIKRLQPAAERMLQAGFKDFTKFKGIVSDVIDKLGGLKNVFKILGITIGAVGLLKALVQFKKLLATIKAIDKAMVVAKLKVMAVIAVIVILALIIEDFIHFMNGNDSVIGKFFDKAGIGADNAREQIFVAFKRIKSFFVNTWQELKKAVEQHGGSIKKSVSKIFGGLLTIAGAILRTLLRIASAVFSDLSNIFEGIDLSTPINAIVSTIDVLLSVLGELGEFISNHSELVGILVESYAAFKLGSTIKQLYSLAKGFAISTAAKIADKAETLAIMALYAKDFVKNLATSTVALAKQAGQFAINTAAKMADVIAQGAMTAATIAWNVAAGIATATTTALGAAIAFLTSPIGIAIAAIAAIIAIGVLLYKNWDTVKEYAISIWESIVGVFQSAWEGIKNIFSKVEEFFGGVWDSIVGIFTSIGTAISDAISSAVKGAINRVLSGAAKIINGFISAINFAVGVINKIPGVEISKIEKLEVPQLAEGGIATQATSAIIGEGAEPEAVIPLSKLGSMISGYIKEAKESDAGKQMSSIMKSAVSALVTSTKAFSRAATASPATAGNSTTNNRNSTVVQNNEFNNSYYGSDREATKNVAKGMKKSAVDATTEMARVLAYGRGVSRHGKEKNAAGIGCRH